MCRKQMQSSRGQLSKRRKDVLLADKGTMSLMQKRKCRLFEVSCTIADQAEGGTVAKIIDRTVGVVAGFDLDLITVERRMEHATQKNRLLKHLHHKEKFMQMHPEIHPQCEVDMSESMLKT